MVDILKEGESNISINGDKSYETNKNPGELYEKGKELSREKEYAEAIKYYEKYIALVGNKNITDDTVLSNLGLAYMRNGNYQEAINYYKKSLAKNPENVITHQNLAGAYRRNGDYKLAVKVYNKLENMGKLTDIDKSNFGLSPRRVGEIERSISVLRSIKEPNDISLSELGLSMKALGMKKGLPEQEKEKYLNEAIINFQESLRKNPNNGLTLSNLANTYIEIGNLQEALIAIGKSLELEPGNYKSLNIQGKLLFTLGKEEEAKKVFERSIQIEANRSKNPLGSEYLEIIMKKGDEKQIAEIKKHI